MESPTHCCWTLLSLSPVLLCWAGPDPSTLACLEPSHALLILPKHSSLVFQHGSVLSSMNWLGESLPDCTICPHFLSLRLTPASWEYSVPDSDLPVYCICCHWDGNETTHIESWCVSGSETPSQIGTNAETFTGVFLGLTLLSALGPITAHLRFSLQKGQSEVQGLGLDQLESSLTGLQSLYSQPRRHSLLPK